MSISSEDFPVIDIKEALSRTMGDTNFLKLMIKAFEDSAAGFLNKIESALHSGNMDILGSEAHQLKGAAANLSIKAVAEAALVLEQMGKTKDTSNGDQAIDRLRAAVEDFRQFRAQMDWDQIKDG